MKPKDLKAPFTWNERCPLIQDGVFYGPHHYEDYASFTPPKWKGPLCVEYGSGNGDWIVERAKKFPEKMWIGVELRFDRVRKIWSKMHNLEIDNLLIVRGSAETFTKHYLSDRSVQEVYINFPDPWPKRRHAKHRMIQPLFVEEMGRILVEKGKLTFVTDDPDYSQWTDEHIAQAPQFSPLQTETDAPEYGSSRFEALWREKGKTIRYTQWTKSFA